MCMIQYIFSQRYGLGDILCSSYMYEYMNVNIAQCFVLSMPNVLTNTYAWTMYVQPRTEMLITENFNVRKNAVQWVNWD